VEERNQVMVVNHSTFSTTIDINGIFTGKYNLIVKVKELKVFTVKIDLSNNTQ